jgi:translation initiation factor 1 (eIF-1/SUI1)
MNPLYQLNEDNILDDEQIIIFTKRQGKHMNTYILNLPIENMQPMLKQMKMKFGCGGSIDTILYDNIECKALHLQGNKIDSVDKYLRQNNITNIFIKLN